MKIREVFAFNIKSIRKKQGFKSSRALAEEIEVSTVTLARIEAGMGLPSEDTLEKISKKLGCEETDLFKDPSEKVDTQKAIDLMQSALNLMKSIPVEYLEKLESLDWDNKNIKTAFDALAKSFAKKDKITKKESA